MLKFLGIGPDYGNLRSWQKAPTYLLSEGDALIFATNLLKAHAYIWRKANIL